MIAILRLRKSQDCAARRLRNLEIVAQSYDRKIAQRNLKIAQIVRLRSTYILPFSGQAIFAHVYHHASTYYSYVKQRKIKLRQSLC